MIETVNFLTLLMSLLTMGALAFGVAALAKTFQLFLGEGMIFESYARFLYRMIDNGVYVNWLWTTFVFPSWLAKPLGLCIYCNGTWIAIAVYLFYFGFSLPIFIFIGLVVYFITLINGTSKHPVNK